LLSSNYNTGWDNLIYVHEFTNSQHAREEDLAQGLALSVECDAQARARLEGLLGFGATSASQAQRLRASLTLPAGAHGVG